MDIAHRKATVKIQLCRADGSPIACQTVKADQISSQFLFGCGCFDAVELFKTNDPAKKAFLSNRLDNWLKLFNYGTLPFYWGRYEPVENHPIDEVTMQGAKFLHERGVTIKGHPLCWHTVCAPWLLKYSNREIISKQINRIHREVSRFKGIIDMWDVINEVVIMPVFDKYDNAVTRICKELGQVQLVKMVFEAAREVNPGATLLINDFNTSPAYERLLEELLEADVSFDVIGIQSHQHQGYWGAEKVHDVLRRFGRFGKPIHFTENTLISGELMPAYIEDLNDWQVEKWPSTPDGEERQAREMAEMFDILYSHPQVEAITIWDPCDGAWLGAPSGVMREDNSPKPVYDALMEKIHGAWETHTTITTDCNGNAILTGTKGMYRLAIGDKTAEMNLAQDGDRIITID